MSNFAKAFSRCSKQFSCQCVPIVLCKMFLWCEWATGQRGEGSSINVNQDALSLYDTDIHIHSTCHLIVFT